MEEIKLKFKSVRFKLFFTMCVVILVIILSLVLINSIVLENFYIYSKTATIKQVYQKVNDYYNTENTNVDLETELKKIAYKNNFFIVAILSFISEVLSSGLLHFSHLSFPSGLGQPQNLHLIIISYF